MSELTFRPRPVRRGFVIFGIYGAAAVAVLQSLYPLAWMLFGSLKRPNEMYTNVWGLPDAWQWGNYAAAWRTGDIGQRVLNSVHVTGLSLLLIALVATPCAYAIARLKFPGSGVLFGICLLAIPFPPPVLGIPLFIVGREIGILNSLNGLAVIYAATMLPLSIVILRAFFIGVPAELEDAATVDGAGVLRTMTTIMVPLVRPGIAFVMMIAFLDIWNEFFLALIFIRSPDLQTIPLGLAAFFQQNNTLWTQYFAAQMIVTAPVFLAFVLVQKQFIAGLAAGSVKG